MQSGTGNEHAGHATPSVSAPATADPHAGHVQTPAATATDPVCGMQVDPKTTVSATVEGQTYHFCTIEGRDRFLENPAAFIGK